MTKPHYESSDWLEWWINPAKDGNSEPDSSDLKQTEDYIARNYPPETQSQIQINVRETREE